MPEAATVNKQSDFKGDLGFRVRSLRSRQIVSLM
jgi:hypothetical protein